MHFVTIIVFIGCCVAKYVHTCRTTIHKRVGQGAPAHAGPTHMVVILVRRPTSVGRLPLTRLIARFLQEEGRAKRVGMLSVCLAHLTLGLQMQVDVKLYNTSAESTTTGVGNGPGWGPN